MNIHIIKENIIALIIALILSLFFVFMISRVDLLKWDIMATDQQKKLQNNNWTNADIQWDINYTVKDGNFIINSNKDIEKLSSLNLTLLFDTEKVKIDAENISSNYEIWLWDAGKWRITVILSVNSIKKWDEMLKIKFDWDQSVINVSDIWVLFTDWTSENLSVTQK